MDSETIFQKTKGEEVGMKVLMDRQKTEG